MALDEGADMRRQPARRKRRHRADGQAVVSVTGAQLVRSLGDLVERLAHAIGIGAARVREHDALAPPLEQRHAQLVFQRAHLMADGAVRNEQLRRCTRKTLIAGCRLEHPQRAK
ncbi:hypothetical+protein [Escherichia coli]|nr:hypothetical+protein [Escherichia coli]